MTNKAMVVAVGAALWLTASYAPAALAHGPAQTQAESLFAATRAMNGLVVHVGCGDGRLTAALWRGGANLVQGLDADAALVAQARQHIQSLGLYGPVSVERWDAPFLPYVANLVNLLVVEGATKIPKSEMLRVLAPRGVAYIKQADKWAKIVKPVPKDTDEWTHYLHDASGNAVARDTVVGPPRSLQWVAGQVHGRSHEYTSSVSTVVSTAGRIFYIADNGQTFPLIASAKWQLVARDAYNGLVLWKRPIRPWFSHLCGWTQAPRELQRRMVAVGDRVYVTMGYFGELSALDAATGKTVATYPQTAGAEEVICQQGILLVVVREITDAQRAEFAKIAGLTREPKSPLQRRDTGRAEFKVLRRTERSAKRSIVALDAATGKTLWTLTAKNMHGIRPLSLRAAGDRVFYQGRDTVCLDLRTGKKVWATRTLRVRVLNQDVVICSSRKLVTARRANTGEKMWTVKPRLCRIRDAFIINGSLWLGGFKPYDTGSKKYTGPVWGPHFATQRDLTTGKFLMEIDTKCPKHHHRCYLNKATVRYMLVGRRGTEFYDLKTGDVYWNSWARGVCRYGVMPCNGLLYKPPHACGCYVMVKLTGFNALAGQRPAADRAPDAARPRLERGPAFEQAAASRPKPALGAQWPTYRGDAQRSCCTRSAVPTALKLKWATKLGVKITPPTVAHGKVFVAAPDRHQLVALAADSGKTAWTFTAGGRIDSPPTIHDGQVLFGCTDGYAYCLRASDGALAWRFRGARSPEHTVAYGQVESISPIHGSVLVHDNALYFTAGRSSFLDDGIVLYRLDPRSGRVLSETKVYSPSPKPSKGPEQYGPAAMPGARWDILSADHEYVYLQHLVFDKQGVQQSTRKTHLFALTGFLDGSWPHRSYYILGDKPSIATGCSGRSRRLIFGRLLAFDDSTVYGYGREYVHWSNEFEDKPYRLFARKRDASKPQWSEPVPIVVRAMILAGDVIFAAGAGEPEAAPKQSAGAQIIAFSASDGADAGRQALPARPIFNGMAAANGQLFLALEGGRVVCMRGQ